MSQILNRELETLTGGYCEEAPGNAEFPYIVFSASRTGDDGGRQQYILEINVWDQGEFYSRAESVMDNIEKELHQHICATDHFLIQIFRGRRQNIPDPDKSIKRVREQFEMYVYEKEK